MANPGQSIVSQGEEGGTTAIGGSTVTIALPRMIPCVAETTPVPGWVGASNRAAVLLTATICPIVEDQFVTVSGTGLPSVSQPPAVNVAVWPTRTEAVVGVTAIRARVPGMTSVTLSIHAVMDGSSHPVRLSRSETARVNEPVACRAVSPLRSTSTVRVPWATGVSDHSTVFPMVTSRFATTLDDEVASRSKTSRSELDRKSTRLNSSHGYISYAVFCLKKKKT